MTQDPNRDDELSFDDEDFIAKDDSDLSPEDGGTDLSDEDFEDAVEQSPAESEDVLFADPKEVNPSEIFAGKPGFTEEGTSDWDPDAADDEELGLTSADEEHDFTREDPLTADPDTLDEGEEIQLIGEDEGFDSPVQEHVVSEDVVQEDEGEEIYALEEEEEPVSSAADSVDPVQAALEAHGYQVQPEGEGWQNVDIGTAAEGADDEWAPVAGNVDIEDAESFAVQGEEDEDPIYGIDEQEEANEAVAAAYHAPDYSEHERGYVAEAGPEGPEMVAAAPRRTLKLFTAVAATALLAVTAVVVWKPELLGLAEDANTVNRVNIARPKVNLDVKPPATLRPVTPPVTRETPPPPVTPPVTRETPPPPVTPPVTRDTPPLALVGNDKQGTGNPLLEGLVGATPFGEDMLLTQFGEYSSVETDIGIEGLTLGSRAFAQLRNGNFFVGTVKRADASHVTLKLDGGEVALDRKHLLMITPLASAEYYEMKRLEKGYVRLTNQNLLEGTILETLLGDHVILEMKANRVLIPKAEVEEITAGGASDIRFDETESDDWLNGILEQELRRAFERQKKDGEPSIVPSVGDPATPGTGK